MSANCLKASMGSADTGSIFKGVCCKYVWLFYTIGSHVLTDVKPFGFGDVLEGSAVALPLPLFLSFLDLGMIVSPVKILL